ncbi:MAG TPA: nucleoside triphosphate pyrophosphatase [Steroidobacteraceae bacterium]|jgi:septum formation protein
MRPLVLASASAYRRELLTRLGVRFDVVAPAVSEEDLAGEVPAERAQRLALAKARTVAQQYPEAIVVGSDQVAAMGARVLHKSGHAAGAREQLMALSGKAADFFTACAIIGARAAVHEAHLDTTHVVFRALSADEIARYIEHERPFDCAGSFKVETLGIALLERIDMTDPTALIGLPLIWVAQTLRRCGYPMP